MQLGGLAAQRRDRHGVLEQAAGVVVMGLGRGRRAQPLAEVAVGQEPVEQRAQARVGDLAGQELDEALERLGVAAGAGHEVERVTGLDLLEVAHGDLQPAAVALDPAEHAHRVTLVEARAEQVDVVPDHARHAAGAVGELHRQERVAVSGVAALLALHGERRVHEGALAQVGHVGVARHLPDTLSGPTGRCARRARWTAVTNGSTIAATKIAIRRIW